MIEIAKKLHKNGLMPLPVNPFTKLRIIEDQFSNRFELGPYHHGMVEVIDYEKIFHNASGIAIATGEASCIEALDMEGKFDLTGYLFDNFRRMVISRLGKCFFDSLVIQTTQHKGWHVLYRSELARAAKSIILALNKNRKCLIETRANNTYVIIEPSEGYKLIQGSYFEIPFISEDQYRALHQIAIDLNEHRSFNHVAYNKNRKSTIII